MTKLKSLYEVLGQDDTTEELYTSDQKKRYHRSQLGPYSRTKGLFNFLQLIKRWEDIVGKMMAENTIPLKIKGSTLFISTKHSIFAQELGFLAPKIIEKVTETFPEVKEKLTKIKFVHSNLSSHEFTRGQQKKMKPKVERKTLHPFSPEYKEIKAKAESMFENINDEEIKKMLIDFMLL